jgi:sulfate permease, SulP family
MPALTFRPPAPRQVGADLLAGLVVSFALIPEVIGFAIAAGYDPSVGLYASFVISMVIAFTGGRPAMISAGAGSVALVTVDLVHAHGVQYLLAAAILAGLIQIACGLLKLGMLMRFVSRSVVTGFINALAILIFSAQVPQLLGAGWQAYAMTAGGLAIIYLFPYVTKAIPAPLVCIVVLTAISMGAGMHLRTIGDMGQLPANLPSLGLPHIPFTFETLHVIAPTALAMAMVGLLESLMTASAVDEMTDTGSSKNRECSGLGIANLVSGLFGGAAGCAMIGQTVLSIRSGARTRIATFAAGAWLLLLTVTLRHWVAQVPMVALVAVMTMVSISTFDWSSLRNIRTTPRTSAVVMLATVAVVVATRDLSQGVLVGVLLSGVFFAFKVARLVEIEATTTADGTHRTFFVRGQIFFASSDVLIESLMVDPAVTHVTLDLSQAHFWDITSAAALDKAVLRLRRQSIQVEMLGLNEATATLLDRHAVHARPAVAEA